MTLATYDLEEIKQRDLPQIIHAKGINVITNVKGYTCRCPFHDDNTPSLHVNKKDGIWVWHCFGCDAGGTVIDFIMKYDSLNFQEATKQLSDGQVMTGHDLQTRQAQEIKLLAKVSEYYHKVFFEDRRGYEYLAQERKIKDPERLQWRRLADQCVPQHAELLQIRSSKKYFVVGLFFKRREFQKS